MLIKIINTESQSAFKFTSPKVIIFKILFCDIEIRVKPPLVFDNEKVARCFYPIDKIWEMFVRGLEYNRPINWFSTLMI